MQSLQILNVPGNPYDKPILHPELLPAELFGHRVFWAREKCCVGIPYTAFSPLYSIDTPVIGHTF